MGSRAGRPTAGVHPQDRPPAAEPGGLTRRRHDILAALAAHGAASPGAGQRRALRLMLLLLARYNWQADTLAIGRDEIARLWAVDPRTVRREIGALRAAGWLTLRRPAARGRVTVYGLGAAAILAATRSAWDRLGPDFAARLSGLAGPAPLAPVAAPVPEGTWGRIRAALAAAEPELARAWFDRLEAVPGPEGGLGLRAPSAFVARYVATHLAGRLEAARDAVAPEAGPIRVLAP